MKPDELLRSLFTRPSVVHARSAALTSLLWALAILLSSALGSAIFVGPNALLTMALIAMVGCSVAAVFIAYFYFMLKDPDRLQSEKFMIEQRKLNIIEMKGIGPVSIENRGDAHQSTVDLDSEPNVSRRESEP